MNKNVLKTMLVAIGLAAGTIGTWGQEVITYQSSESAYIDASQPDMNLNGKSNSPLLVYNTQYRDWGSSDGTIKMNTGAKIAFYKFSLDDIKANNGTITNATFKFTATGSGNCYNIRALGYNADWNENEITFNNISNNAGDISGTVTASGSFQPLGTKNALGTQIYPTTFEIDVLDYLRSAIDANKDYVSFAITMNLSRVLSLNPNATLEITTTTAAQTTYTIKFQDENGITLKDDVTYECSVGENITASDEDMSDFYNSDKTKKYKYISGNTSFKAESDGNVITLTFKEIPKYTVTINAIDQDEQELMNNIASTSAFEGETTIAYWSKYINVDGKWYVTESKKTEPFLGIEASSELKQNVVYSPTEIAYFTECEDMNTSSSTAWAAFTDVPKRFSNGSGYRLAANRYAYTDPLPGGSYRLKIFSRHTKSTSQSLSLYVRAEDGTLTDLNIDYITYNGTTENDGGIITIPNGCSLVIYNDAEYNSNVVLDYLYLIKCPTISITDAGVATFTPSVALDFSKAKKIAAYKASVRGTTVNLTKVKTVAAGEGVLVRSLDGQATTEDIPVAADVVSTSDGNMFVGTLTDIESLPTNGEGYINYILNNGSKGLGFYRANNQTVAAGKAYLAVPASSAAKISFFSLDGGTVGIEGIESNEEAKEDVYYTISGQRVAAPTKGLYIKNGKKVIVK